VAFTETSLPKRLQQANAGQMPMHFVAGMENVGPAFASLYLIAVFALATVSLLLGLAARSIAELVIAFMRRSQSAAERGGGW
jgi:hypothetical protein